MLGLFKTVKFNWLSKLQAAVKSTSTVFFAAVNLASSSRVKGFHDKTLAPSVSMLLLTATVVELAAVGKPDGPALRRASITWPLVIRSRSTMGLFGRPAG